MAVLRQVMRSEHKLFASKKFEGLHNYDAWLTEFLDWIDQQDQSIKDFVSKKFGYEKTHESVKYYYDTLLTEELKKLKRQINISLCTLLKNSLDTTKVDSSFNDYHHTLEDIEIVGEKDPIARKLAEFKSHYKSTRYFEDKKRHTKMWPTTTDWKIEWMSTMFNPFKYTDNALIDLFESFKDKSFDKDFDKGVELESRPGRKSHMVADDLLAHCKRNLNISGKEQTKTKNVRKIKPKHRQFSHSSQSHDKDKIEIVLKVNAHDHEDVMVELQQTLELHLRTDSNNFKGISLRRIHPNRSTKRKNVIPMSPQPSDKLVTALHLSYPWPRWI
uniref:Uncharacterized protein n=1 Tax=Candidozyma auris TaxID=498019 RepID=A0A0L0P3M1_CANAR